MAQVDFTKEELLSDVREVVKEAFVDFEPRVREIVGEELVAFEPRIYDNVKKIVTKIVKLEVMEAEGRIKQEIRHFVAVDQREMQRRLKSAAAILASDS